MNDLEKEMLMEVYYLLDSGRINDAKMFLAKLLGIENLDTGPGPEAA